MADCRVSWNLRPDRKTDDGHPSLRHGGEQLLIADIKTVVCAMISCTFVVLAETRASLLS